MGTYEQEVKRTRSLITLAAKFGDDEAVEALKQELRLLNSQALGAVNVQAARDKEYQRQLAEAGPMGRTLLGAGQGAQNVVLQGKDILSRVAPRFFSGMRPSKQEWSEFREASDPIQATPEGYIGSMAGEMGMSLPAGAIGGKAVGLLGRGAKWTGMERLPRWLGGKLAETMGVGAGIGTVMSGPEARGEGALFGAGGAAALHMGARGARNLYAGFVKPTKHAEFLMDRGVEDMTPGRYNPNSLWGQFEEAATSFPWIGPALKRAREKTKHSLDIAMINRTARPAGGRVTIRPDMDVDEALDRVWAGFDRAYKPFHNKPVAPVILSDVLYDVSKSAIGNPVNINVAPGRYLKLNKAMRRLAKDMGGVLGLSKDDPSLQSILNNIDRIYANIKVQPKLPVAGPNNTNSSGILNAVRELRIARQASLKKDNSYAIGKIYRALEDALLDGVIERDVPGAVKISALRQKYWAASVLEDAYQASMGRPEGSTPREVLGQIRKRGGYIGFNRPNELQKMAFAGRQVFEPRVPLTGARFFMTLATPLTAPFIGPGAFSPGFAKALAGRTRPQRFVKSLEEKLLAGMTQQEKDIAMRAAQAGFGSAAGLNLSPNQNQSSYEDQSEQIRKMRERLGM